MKKTRSLMLAGGLALSLTLTACGGGGDEAKAAESISQSMMESSDDSLTVDEKQADCIGKGMVDKIGVDQLKEYGLLNDDLTANESVGEVTMEAKDADGAAETIVGCVDTQKMMADELAADGTLTEEQQKCFSDALDDEAMKKMFSLLFQGKEEEATKDLMGPALSCLM